MDGDLTDDEDTDDTESEESEPEEQQPVVEEDPLGSGDDIDDGDDDETFETGKRTYFFMLSLQAEILIIDLCWFTVIAGYSTFQIAKKFPNCPNLKSDENFHSQKVQSQ